MDPRVVLQVGNLSLDPASCEVCRAGVPLSLTRKEFTLLEALLRNAGRVMMRDRLIERVWGDSNVDNNSLDVLMRQLRAKIDPPGSRKLIHTIRGLGYTIREEEPA